MAIGKRNVRINRGVDHAGVIPQRRVCQGVVDVGELRVQFGLLRSQGQPLPNQFRKLGTHARFQRNQYFAD